MPNNAFSRLNKLSFFLKYTAIDSKFSSRKKNRATPLASSVVSGLRKVVLVGPRVTIARAVGLVTSVSDWNEP